MRRVLFIFLAFSLPVVGQTQPKSKALLKCESNLSSERAAMETCLRTQVEMTNDALSRMSEKVALVAENDKLKADNAALAAKYEELRKLALEVSAYAHVAADQDQKIRADYDALVNKYNALLGQANSEMEAANARLARQQRIQNALTMYSLMPKYAPPQTINLQVSNCNALPALCIH